jgi:hypothetical protein
MRFMGMRPCLALCRIAVESRPSVESSLRTRCVTRKAQVCDVLPCWHVACILCETAHTNRNRPSVESSAMEFMLLIWDELDDVAHACRHVASTTVSEVAQVSAPLVTALVAAAATFWGGIRDFLP